MQIRDITKNMKGFTTEIKLLQLKALQETAGNPQRMDDKIFTGLVDSIKRKGWYFAMPDIWEHEPGQYKIISGHHRIRAAIKAGLVEQSCNVIIDPNYTEEQAKKDLLESNERHGSPDQELLTDFVTNLIDDFDVDFDTLVDEIGIDDSILNNILIKDNEKDDEVPDVPEVAFSQPGDLYLLNNHRVLCGDSTDENHICKLMKDSKYDLLFTDPPYNVAEKGKNVASNIKNGKAYNVLKNSNWDYGFIPERFLDKVFNFSGLSCSFFIFTSHFLFGEIQSWMERNLNYDNYCVWCKPNPMPSLTKKRFTWATELLNYGTKKDFVFNFPESGHLFNYINIQSPKHLTSHPTEKPVEILTKIINISSKNQDVVFDGFLGSGSILIASEKTNRICYGMELDEHYIDVIVKRYIDYIGNRDNCFLIRDNNKIPLVDIKEF
jgi:DNA modification methylase